MPSEIKTYTEVIQNLNLARALEKIAQTTGAEEDSNVQTAHAGKFFTFLKTAASPLAWGLGIGVPATAGAALVTHLAGREARDTAADIRTKALQVAAGIAALSGGLYGMHRLTQPREQTTTTYGYDQQGQAVPMSTAVSKTGSQNESSEALIEKLATVGYLDVLLEEQEKTGATKQIRDDATDCRLLNAEHGIDLLSQLLE